MSKIKLRGIERNLSDDTLQDGSCEEIVNLRPKDGSLRIAAEKQLSWNFPHNCQSVFKHYIPDTDNEQYAGYNPNSHTIDFFNPTTGMGMSMPLFDSTETFLNLSSLGIFLRVCTDKNMYLLKWDYDTSAYVILDDIMVPDFWFASRGKETHSVSFMNTESDIWTMTTQMFDYLNSQYAVLKKDKKEIGLITGHVCFRLAFKLWDGTYIKHSAPFYMHFGEADDNTPVDPDPGHHDEMLLYNTDSGQETDWHTMSFVNCTFSSAGLRLNITSEFKNILQDYKGLIKELVIFGTGEVERYKLSTSASEYIHFWTGGVAGQTGTERRVYTVPKDEEVENVFADISTYYRIQGISINELLEMDGLSDEIEINLGDYSTIETREALPIDSFSAHRLISNTDYVYNQRLHLGDITAKLGIGYNPTYLGPKLEDGYLSVPTSGPLNREYYIEWTLETDKGKRIIRELFSPYMYEPAVKPFSYYKIYLPSFFGYPDNRATRMRILSKSLPSGTIWYEVADFELKAHPFLNMAINTKWNDTYNTFYWQHVYVWVLLNSHDVTTVEDTDDLYYDTNRVQVSNQNNLLHFPAINSYQVHNEDITIVGISSQSMPLSEGQFGQFPLYIFTSDGIWYMVQGAGDVLYERTLPLNKEIAVSGSVLGLGDVMMYCTIESVKIISGREVINISKRVEGDIVNPLINKEQYQGFINSSAYTQIIGFISCTSSGPAGVYTQIDFSEYIQGAIVAYDNVNEEIIISNSSHNFSYVYRKEEKTWHKIGMSFDQFVIDPDGNLLLDGSNAYLLESEVSNRETDCFFQTRPFSFDSTAYKRIKRLILRLRAAPYQRGKHTFLLLYGSNNGEDYKLLSGIDPSDADYHYLMLRQTWASCRYFILAWGLKAQDSITIDDIEIDVNLTENKKIR